MTPCKSKRASELGCILYDPDTQKQLYYAMQYAATDLSHKERYCDRKNARHVQQVKTVNTVLQKMSKSRHSRERIIAENVTGDN